MRDWQMRVVSERYGLSMSLDRLCTFINADGRFKSLPDGEKERLLKQHQIMNDYLAVLSERIENFKE